MKKRIFWLVPMFAVMFLLFTGCSSEEKLMVGEQVSKSKTEFDKDITDEKKIGEIVTLFNGLEETSDKEEPESYPGLVLLNKTKEDSQRFSAFIWLEENPVIVQLKDEETGERKGVLYEMMDEEKDQLLETIEE
ncbi:MAG TPA: hypothetical protein VK108_00055 [Pseudogracilibacillus sp.]|nr:hypothetical protein [Pseudogracilibacillus sp.]